MQLLLQRKTLTNRSTIGELFVDGKLQCFTLEQVYREVSNEPVRQWKIANLTAVPLGTYQLSLGTFRPQTNPQVNPSYTAPLLENVEDFDGVFIHVGNSPADTEGCILVGTEQSADWVSNSHEAFEHLFDAVKSSIATGGVLLTIEMYPDLQSQLHSSATTKLITTGRLAKPSLVVEK